ncbi:MAG: NAD(P)-binding protein [Bdellovibrionales bacterium]
MSSYDTIIVGGGLTGLLLTHRLHLAGQKVALLDAREALGGRYHRQSFRQPFSSPNLDFFPATNENVELTDWVKSVAPIPLHFEVREHRPQIFDDGKWKPFAGFGDVSFQSVSELSFFNHSHELHMEPGTDQLVRALVEQLPIAAHTLAEVTSIHTEEDRVRTLIVNGDKTLAAERFIFTPHPTLLNGLIEGDGLAPKHRTRLAKMTSWTAVILELSHSPALVEDSDVRLFSHGAKDFEPVVGRVFGELSRWMTLVPEERESDHEFIGQCIRHIKRQLKRAWPLALEGPQTEKIYILSRAFGQHNLKGKDPFRFPEFSNFYVSSHALAEQPGALGSLEIARSLEAELLGGLNRLPELGASC